MKALTTMALAAALAAGLPAVALAQSGTQPARPPAAKPQPAAAKPAPGRNPQLARSAQKAVEERTPVDEDADVNLTPADLEIAKLVYVGEIPCELGASVRITPARREGVFVVTTRNYRFRMHPVESRTGAIRLEDPRRGAMWLQLGNKSMLMSQKLGQRLADECQSPQQVTFAEALKRNPVPSVLDALPPAAAPAAVAVPVAPAIAPLATPAVEPASAAPAAPPQATPALERQAP